MKLTRLIIFLFTLFTLPAFAEDYKIVGYYPNWAIYRTPSFKPQEIDGNLITHINYAFAKVDTSGNILLIDSWADTDYRSEWNSERPYWGNFKALADLKQKYPHLKTLISVGGWTLSDTFSAVAADPKTRTHFAQSAVAFCKKYGFDGVDIDWEYPGFAEHGGRPQDKQNFTRLLAELHTAAKAQNPPLLVTIAAPAGPDHCRNMEVDRIHPYLDWINLMTYDMHGPWGSDQDTVTNHQAALYPPAVGSPDLSVNNAVRYYLSQAVPAHKLVIGMPLYGRVFANASGLYTSYNGAGPGTTAEMGIRFFNDIKHNLLGKDYKPYWDNKAQASYLYSQSQKEFITYDDEATLRLKSQFIKQLNLGGAMVWELGLDSHPQWEAMHAISDELKRK
jgi:chitinase